MTFEEIAEAMRGATVLRIDGAAAGEDEVLVVTDRGTLRLNHEQDCCESVAVEDVIGDPADLVGGVVLLVEERVNPVAEEERGGESSTWTFYEIQTSTGDITIRWLGSSNGWYSENVSADWTPAAVQEPS